MVCWSHTHHCASRICAAQKSQPLWWYGARTGEPRSSAPAGWSLSSVCHASHASHYLQRDIRHLSAPSHLKIMTRLPSLCNTNDRIVSSRMTRLAHSRRWSQDPFERLSRKPLSKPPKQGAHLQIAAQISNIMTSVQAAYAQDAVHVSVDRRNGQ